MIGEIIHAFALQGWALYAVLIAFAGMFGLLASAVMIGPECE